MRRSLFSAIVVGLFLGSAALAAPEDQDVFENFDGITPNTEVGVPFDVGVTPNTATFSGDGFAGVANIGELYFSGIRAWMVNPSGTGVVTFETNAAVVEFWTRLRTGANGSSVYTAYDDNDQVINAVTINTPGPFQLVSFTGDIDRIEVVNNATGNGQMNSIDDFGFTPVPEPATAVMLGLIALAALREPRSRERIS